MTREIQLACILNTNNQCFEDKLQMFLFAFMFSNLTLTHNFQDLRKQLDKILEDRIVSPRAVDLTVSSKEQVIINAIVDLISKEEVTHHDFRDDDQWDSNEVDYWGPAKSKWWNSQGLVQNGTGQRKWYSLLVCVPIHVP